MSGSADQRRDSLCRRDMARPRNKPLAHTQQAPLSDDQNAQSERRPTRKHNARHENVHSLRRPADTGESHGAIIEGDGCCCTRVVSLVSSGSTTGIERRHGTEKTGACGVGENSRGSMWDRERIIQRDNTGRVQAACTSLVLLVHQQGDTEGTKRQGPAVYGITWTAAKGVDRGRQSVHDHTPTAAAS